MEFRGRRYDLSVLASHATVLNVSAWRNALNRIPNGVAAAVWDT